MSARRTAVLPVWVIVAARADSARPTRSRHYIINGTKKWITNGIWSDYFSKRDLPCTPFGSCTRGETV